VSDTFVRLDLRLDLAEMQQHLGRLMRVRQAEIEQVVNTEIDAFLKDFDFAREVQKHMRLCMEEVIRTTIERHFRHGEGRKTLERELGKMLLSRKVK
jgi:hypothetical protein